MQSYLAFLQSLIQIDSTNPPGNEQAIIQQFINRSEATGLPYQVMTVDNNRSNFSVRINGSNTDKGKLLLNGHTDTVKIGSQEWQYNPQCPFMSNNYLFMSWFGYNNGFHI